MIWFGIITQETTEPYGYDRAQAYMCLLLFHKANKGCSAQYTVKSGLWIV